MESLRETFHVMKIEKERVTNTNEKNRINNKIKNLQEQLMRLEEREEELNELLYAYLQTKQNSNKK